MPFDVRAPQEVKERILLPKDQEVRTFLKSSVSDVETFIGNVNTMAEAKNALRIIAKVVLMLARHVLKERLNGD